MSLYDFFKNIFGIKDGISRSNPDNVNSDENNYRDQFVNPNYERPEDPWRDQFINPNYERPEDPWSSPHDDRPSDGISQFNVITDPLEMHRFFEQQMEEVFKAFGMFGDVGKAFFGDMPGFGSDGGSFFSFGNVPAIESYEETPNSSNLRDHLLKPGYKRPDGKSTGDSDLDGKINPGDVDSLLKNGPSNDSSLQRRDEFQNSIMPQIRSFGQSVSTKTIRNPDGSVETHRTVRDSSGNEETTITKQLGDKQYTVTVRTNKDGKQERIEDLINMEEKDLPEFNARWQQPKQPHPNHGGNGYSEYGQAGRPDWGDLFDKFFR